MKDTVFFHVRNSISLPHTYCIKKGPQGDLYVGYSIVHEKDQFCRKVGCQLAEKKANIAMGIKDDNFTISKVVTLMDTTGKKEQTFTISYPPSIENTLPVVIQRAGEIMKLSGKVYVKTIVSPNKRRIPFAKIFDILPVE
jgi:hypothetical protein